MSTAADAITTNRRIDTVIFDLGGVLMRNGRHSDFVKRFPSEHAETALRIFVGPFGVDTDHPWHRLERGEISMEECQALNRAAFASAGIEMPARPVPTPEPTDDGSAPEAAPMMTFMPNEEMIDLVGRLRRAGLRTGMLTNNVREFRELWRPLMPYDELFDDIVDSHEVGLRKPNPAIYQLALTRLSAAPERTAFLDDLPSNVDAATSLGMFGVLVDEDSTGAISIIERLAALA